MGTDGGQMVTRLEDLQAGVFVDGLAPDGTARIIHLERLATRRYRSPTATARVCMNGLSTATRHLLSVW